MESFSSGFAVGFVTAVVLGGLTLGAMVWASLGDPPAQDD